MAVATQMGSVTIEAGGLVKRFGEFTAVAGIDFEVREGEIYGFLGPNGSGKTTTIRMMLGLLQPTEGSMQVLGIAVREHPARIRPRVGYMSQQFSLYRDLTVLQNLHFYGTAYGLTNKDRHARIAEALELTGLVGREHVRTGELAGGLRQRLALGAAILHHPKVLFLDEPTAGVDPVSRRAFWELLYHLAGEGVTVFVTTHYMDEAEHCHRLAFIQRGRIIASGSPEELKRGIMSGGILELAPSDTAAAVKILRGARQEGRLDLQEIELYGPLVHVAAANLSEIKNAIEDELHSSGVDPGSAAIIEPSLEDAFIACMR